MNRPSKALRVLSHIAPAIAAVSLALITSLVIVPAAPAQVPSPAAAPAAAPGPTTLPASIPSQARTATEMSPYAASIKEYVQTEVKNLTSGNPGAQKEAREKLESPVSGIGSTGGPSDVFVAAYVAALKEGLAPVVNDKSIRVRLNTAIVVERVSDRTNDASLADLVLALLKDKSNPVAMWGVKAAQHVVLALVKAASPEAVKMADAITQCVKDHESAPIAQEAYLALDLGGLAAVKNMPLAGPMIPAIQNVMAIRLQRYTQVPVEDPLAEREPIGYLTYPSIWKLHTPEQQKKTLQLLTDIVQLAAKQFSLTTNRADKEPLIRIVNQAANGLKVLAPGVQTDPALEGAVSALGKAFSNSDGTQLVQQSKLVYAEMQKTIPGLQPAPEVKPPATTAPTAAGTGSMAPADTGSTATPAAETVAPAAR